MEKQKRGAGMQFDYDAAFDRNIGWLTTWEQQRMRGKTVAIAGMGGVGGAHLLTLARLGVGGFHIADLDEFEIGNFNRQVGATTRSIGRAKVDVMEEMARDINPSLRIERFPAGVDESSVDEFLRGVDLYVDGLDFFVPEVRSLVFRRCAELGIPAITAAPIGMGTSYLIFMPGEMTFEQYFGLEGHDHDEQLLRFYLGLVPRALHRTYLVDPTRLNLEEHRGPSTPMAIQLCASVIGTEATKILLGRGRIYPAPHCHQFDIYRGRWVRTKVRSGHRGVVNGLKRTIARRMLAKNKTTPPLVGAAKEDSYVENGTSTLEQILDLARWAPSGDNGQPWRFEPRSDSAVRIHVEDEAEHDVYDFDGRASILSAGMLLETMRVAASQHGRDLNWTYRALGHHHHHIDVQLPRQSVLEPDGLASFVRIRSVDRRPYRLDELSRAQRQSLEDCLGDELEIRWMAPLSERLRFARLNAETSALRLRIPEAAAVHERILDFQRALSPTGVASLSLGLDPALHAMMRWAMRKPERQEKMIQVMGTGGPSMEMDILPGLFCGAHFMVAFREEPTDADRGAALLRAGARLQRFWLRATELGLAMQPSVAPLSFAFHAEKGARFTDSAKMRAKADDILDKVRAMWPGHTMDEIVFAGRVGTPQAKPPKGRSVRRPLEELMVEGADLRAISRDTDEVRISA